MSLGNQFLNFSKEIEIISLLILLGQGPGYLDPRAAVLVFEILAGWICLVISVVLWVGLVGIAWTAFRVGRASRDRVEHFGDAEVGPRATQLLRPPARILLLFSLLAIGINLLTAIATGVVGYGISQLFDDFMETMPVQGFVFVCAFVLNFVGCFLVGYGAICMLRLRRRWIALLAAWLSLIPVLGPFYVLSIPFGIWALIALNKTEVKQAFHTPSKKNAIMSM